MNNYKGLVAGQDECGKGEYYGSMVVGSFIVDYDKPEMVKDLESIGIKDSKLLKSNKIKEIYNYLEKKYKSYINYTIIPLKEYNLIYSESNNQLNILFNVYKELILSSKKLHNVNHYIIDKFTNSKKLLNDFEDLEKDNNIIIEKHYKADTIYLPVKTASIVAKYHSIIQIEELSNKYGCDFSVGSSLKAVPEGLKFVTKYGIEELNNVAKLHFKITDQILNEYNKNNQ